MSSQYDAVIIGAGHNGLVCACYLAAAGLRVRVLERRPVVGGAAVTEEFHPGFRNSTASYTVSLLHPRVIADLNLHAHGLRIVERPLANFLPLSATDHLLVGDGLVATQAEFAKYSASDAARLPEYYARLERVADVLRELALQTPPNAGGGLGDVLKALKLGKRLSGVGLEVQRDLLELFTLSAAEFLDRFFESDPVRAVFGFDAVVGNFASPYTPGSAYVLLHHVFGEVNGKKGQWGHAIGGMGAITQAMAREAEARGVEISLESPVREVRADAGRVRGVTLEDGTQIDAARVIGNVNPSLLYNRMLPAEALPEDFRERMRHYRNGSGTFRMNVALSELPRFECLPEPGRQLQAGIIMAPSLDYMDRAYRDARQDGFAREPIVEMLIPSTVDDSLAPPGKHVASLFCQHFHPTPPAGQSWDVLRNQAVEAIFATVNRFAPNFRASVEGYLALSPLDLERRFGLVGGDIFHGRLSLEQLFSARPVLGHGDYRGPLKGLYMCGSGTHPGGGVTGMPGFNAAREILRDRRPWYR